MIPPPRMGPRGPPCPGPQRPRLGLLGLRGGAPTAQNHPGHSPGRGTRTPGALLMFAVRACRNSPRVPHSDRKGTAVAETRSSMRQRTEDEEHPAPATTADHLAVPEPHGEVGLVGSLVAATYERALGSAGDAPALWGYRALSWLSGHLAAMHRAVYPAARRRLGENQQLLRRCRAEARETAWALRVLQSHLAGDGGTGARQPGIADTWLQQCLDEYRSAEHALIAWLQARLTAQEHEHLAAAYRAALTRAPTRPHPRGPHTGWPGHAAFRFHALWDGLLDGVDSRPGVRRTERSTPVRARPPSPQLPRRPGGALPADKAAGDALPG